MNRLLFEKKGNAIWISHLDLMRLFQRAFMRSGLKLKHTQGFSPRAIVSIALPMSVGVESCCEILDYELDGQAVPPERVRELLNGALPAGVRVLQAYESARKIKELSYLDCAVTMEYDSGVPEDARQRIGALFGRECLNVEKRGKNGPAEQDIIPMIRRVEVQRRDENTLVLRARVCAQNPSLNPALLAAAVERYEPEMKPDFVKVSRLEVLDPDGGVFR